MPSICVKPSSLNGVIQAPPSKSHSLRAILFASLAQGRSRIKNRLSSPDVAAMIAACRQLGAVITEKNGDVDIVGVAGQLSVSEGATIDAGNSGQVLRYLAAVVATQEKRVTITGDDSICSNRPIKPYIDSFSQLGVDCVSLAASDFAPIAVKGPFRGNQITVDGEDSQVVTGLCIAAVLVPGDTVINVVNAGEKPWIDLTIDWLRRLGVGVARTDYAQFIVSGHALSAFDYCVPGDFSSAAFPCAAALVTQSPLRINGVDWSDAQGDKALFYALKSMGAKIEMDTTGCCLQVAAGPLSPGAALDINDYVDAITILAVLGCYATAPLQITGAAIAREKESDRIAAICNELSRMGANITPQSDGMIVAPSRLSGAVLHSHHDHRIAMSLAVAAMAADGETVIEDTACIDKSYPHFVEQFRAHGARIERVV